MVDAPTNVHFNDTSIEGELTIDWDSVSRADKYYIYRALSSGSTTTDYSKIAEVSSPPYTDNNLNDGEKYFYRLSSYINWNQDSFESNNNGENWDTVNGTTTDTYKNSGTYSLESNGTDPFLVNNFNGEKYSQLGFAWCETSDNQGIGYEIYGDDGNLVDVVGSSSPDYESETHNPSGGYWNTWEHVWITIDWANQTLDYDWRDDGTYSTSFYNSTANGLGKIELGDYNWDNGNSATISSMLWVDDVYGY